MRDFLLGLDAALVRGAALAALSLTSSCGGDTSTPEPTVEAPALDPYPSEAVACTGEDHDSDPNSGVSGLHGRCCTQAACYTPDDGVCATAQQAPQALGKTYGSGRCLCGEIQGPFAPNPSDAPSSAGSCCYLIPSIGCDGRPLLIDGVALVAPLAARQDWLSRELLALLA